MGDVYYYDVVCAFPCYVVLCRGIMRFGAIYRAIKYNVFVSWYIYSEFRDVACNSLICSALVSYTVLTK